jgi:hypothetical protein
MKISNWFSFTEINPDLDWFLKSKEDSTAPVAFKNDTIFPAYAS